MRRHHDSTISSRGSSPPVLLPSVSVVCAGDPKELELEKADAIYKKANEQLESRSQRSLKPLMPSMIDGLLWSLGGSNLHNEHPQHVGCPAP